MTSRELVKATLEFRNTTGVAPQQLWVLPWAHDHHAVALAKINEDFPADIVGCGDVIYAETAKETGDPYAVGTYIDAWGAVFDNIHPGVIGEVKHPIIEDWDDTSRVHFPREWLSFDVESANAFCRSTDKFVTGGCCPRPFEQTQFLRGSENLYIDLAEKPAGMLRFLREMHAFYCELVEKWCQTEVDGINFMDDWGSQNTLLISPKTWVEIFKPMYKDYIDIAHKYGKKIFMHSDGNTLSMIPHLIELGLDALNTQIFCIGVENLAQFKGQITFWGEIDRQHLLPNGTLQDIENAVRLVRDTLWENGGCIAQCEFSAGGKPENVRKVFETWATLGG